MRHLLLAVLLVAMTGCGPDTKPEVQPAPVQSASSEETVSSPETPNASDEPSAKAGVSAVNSIGMRFVPIPAGTFTMGEGKTSHKVTLTQLFELGVYEVTQEQYEQVMGKNPSKFKGPQNPVQMVSWDDAVEFCRKLSAMPAEKKAGYVYRLPTEAEWEYACRAGTTTEYSFGDSDSELGDYAWFAGNSGKTTHSVGSKMPNAWGLYDMHGNVLEWCQDWYGDYPSGSVTDPTGPTSGSAPLFDLLGDKVRARVLRGGAFLSQPATTTASAYRGLYPPDNSSDVFGFRLARTHHTVADQAKAAQKITRREFQIDLKSNTPSPHMVSGMKIYAEPFGAVMYWAPEKLNSWGEVVYRFDLPGAVKTIEQFGLGCTVYNQHATPAFDPASQGEILVSRDGKNWDVIYRSRSNEPVLDTRKDAIAHLKGSGTIFVKARLFATRSLNRNLIQVSQFLRSEPAKANYPQIKLTME